MFEIGRVCVKIAGRDAGEKCVVVDVLDNKFVLVDGMTRRRKCNVIHLEPLEQVLQISKGASHDVVINAFKDLGHAVKTTKPKTKMTRIKAVRKVTAKEAAPAKKGKKA